MRNESITKQYNESMVLQHTFLVLKNSHNTYILMEKSVPILSRAKCNKTVVYFSPK